MYASSLTKSNSSACGTSSIAATTTGQYRRTTALRSAIEPRRFYQGQGSSVELQRLLDGQGFAAGRPDEHPGLHLPAGTGQHLGIGPAAPGDGFGTRDPPAWLHRPAQKHGPGGHLLQPDP